MVIFQNGSFVIGTASTRFQNEREENVTTNLLSPENWPLPNARRMRLIAHMECLETALLELWSDAQRVAAESAQN